MLQRFASCVVAASALGGALLVPSAAKAWVVAGPVYGAPVVVVPGYRPPPVVVVAPRVWIRPHYDRFGYFVPGHWR